MIPIFLKPKFAYALTLNVYLLKTIPDVNWHYFVKFQQFPNISELFSRQISNLGVIPDICYLYIFMYT